MKKVCLLNLGCKVNQYEIDGILNSLKGEYTVITDLDMADIFIVNTCAVTNEAEKKSRQILAKIRKINPDAEIFVCGCASQNNPQQFLNKQNVKAVFGNTKKGQIKNYLSQSGCFVEEIGKTYEDDYTATNVRTRGYVKIQDGCNNFCSYCLIPYVRGRSRSRSLESIVKEAKALSKTCKEIVLTGINVSDYRINNKLALHKVLLALKDLPCRIRLSSMEVGIITHEFLEAVKSMKNFCPHFHLSLQSGCDKVLKDMNRHYTTSTYLGKVRMIESYFDNPCITTDIIVGFPTENDIDFEKTLNFVKIVKFSDIHYFAYSSRPGTRVAHLQQLNGAVIKDREKKLEKIRAELNKEYRQKCLNQTYQVLIEKVDENSLGVGFSQNYVKCYVQGNCSEGELVQVETNSLYLDGLLCKKLDN